MKPKKYQRQGIDDIFQVLKNEDRVLYQLPTGGGKTFLFSFLSKEFIGSSNKKVLILAHRTELIQQTVNTLFNIGVRSESVVASKKYLNHSSQVYVSMVQTLLNRVTKNPYFLPKIDLIIVDEAHILLHEKLFSFFEKAKIVAVTATPSTQIVEKTIRLLPDGSEMEYKQKFGLHKIYKNFIQGYGIENLVADGDLVPEIVFLDNQIDRSTLEVDSKTSDFKPSNNHVSRMCTVTNYEKFSKGKKTIIFTASTKDNLSTLNDFKNKGYENVRIFDSVNKEESGDRQDLLKWFKNTPDAILINTNVFSVGFDEPTIESVILSMSTLSIAKYHQMVGRGGRSTKKIFKSSFLLIDLGGNVDTFGKWSEPVDWAEHFYLTSKLLPKKEALDKITFCDECDKIIPATASICPFCGHEKPPKLVRLSEDTVHVAELIYPSGKKIAEYCEMYGKDKSFAVELLLTQAVDLFIYTETNLQNVEATIRNGNFFKTMRRILDEEILIIQNSVLSGNYSKNHITELIDKLYKTLK